MNLTICIGCDEYEHLDSLHGAVSDSKRVFEALTGSKLYDESNSSLLLSPTLDQVRGCLREVTASGAPETITIYFAGHAGMKAGTFYLCLRDSDLKMLSTTAFAIAELFAVIGEMQPRQVNFVLDACESAGAMFDLHALLKPEIIGQSGSSSVAFLAACASDQYAQELESGGIATTALIAYLSGERRIQENRAYLDLIEVGMAVSRDVRAASSSQHPVAWGVNLYGDGVFAANPHFSGSDSSESFRIGGIAENSSIGLLIKSHTERLWDEYRMIVLDHDPIRLGTALRQVQSDLKESYPRFLRGFARALAPRAAASNDTLARSDVLAVSAIGLLSCWDSPEVTGFCQELLVNRLAADQEILTDLRDRLVSDPYALLAPTSALADLHFLPLRVTALLGWMTIHRFASIELGVCADEVAKVSNDVLRLLFRHYSSSLIAVSDEQAASVYMFARLGQRFGWESEICDLLDRLFDSALRVGGRVLRINASGKDAADYTLARAGRMKVTHEQVCNPSELLSVLLLMGHRYQRASRWDYELEAFDGISLSSFVPDDWKAFGESIMADGRNYVQRLGHDVWSLEEYSSAFERNVIPHVESSARNMTSRSQLVCAIAAHIFQDRVPYLMEAKDLEPAMPTT
jgi:hypothetical protein